MIEAVLFDYGMVLTGLPDRNAWARMLSITGLGDAEFRAAYWKDRHAYDRGDLNGVEYWSGIGGHLGKAAVRELIEQDTLLWTLENQPMVEWAGRLQAAGTRTGILSNLGDEMMHGVLARMPWLDHFNHRTFSHLVRLAKPESAIYRQAIDGLGVSPEHILFVDDRADNCDGGRAAGLQVIQYEEHERFLKEMERRGFGTLWRTGRMA
jgi:putative hydrolase of the HAD superfamily